MAGPAVGRAAATTAPAATAAPRAAATAAHGAGPRLRLWWGTLSPGILAGKGVGCARARRRSAPGAGGCQAGQALQLTALALDLTLEGGELA